MQTVTKPPDIGHVNKEYSHKIYKRHTKNSVNTSQGSAYCT